MKLDAYEEQLLAFAREIVVYLCKSGVKKEEAQDVVQDVLVKMLESDFVIPAAKMRAWMYRVSIRLYIDKYRRKQHYREILQQEFFEEQLLPADQGQYDFLLEEVEKLPTKDQVLLDLYYFQGFSTKEIASILSLSFSKVKIDLHRSRKKLRQALEQKGMDYGHFRIACKKE